jgi:hypothetical protein
MHPWVGSGSADWFHLRANAGLSVRLRNRAAGERALAKAIGALPNLDWAVAMCYN